MVYVTLSLLLLDVIITWFLYRSTIKKTNVYWDGADVDKRLKKIVEDYNKPNLRWGCGADGVMSQEEYDELHDENDQ